MSTVCAAVLVLASLAPPAAAATSWIDTRPQATREMVDPGISSPVSYELAADGSPLRIELPFTVELAEGSYRALDVSAAGWARLAAGGGGATPAPTARRVIEPVAGDALDVPSPPGQPAVVFHVYGARPGAPGKGRLLVQEGDGFVTLRWHGFLYGTGLEAATFDLMLAPSGMVRYQYYVVPAAPPRGLRIGVETAAGFDEAPSLAGRAPRAGDAVELTPLEQVAAAPATGDDAAGPALPEATCADCPANEPAWCVQARATNAGCTSYADARTCATLRSQGYSCCSDTVNSNPPWHFRESAFCMGCSYTFYALVECGTEMHLPLDDMEGARIRVTEFLSGQPVPITCRNQQAFVPGFHLVNCDRSPTGPGPEDSYYDAPAFNQSNAADPTQFVSWGFGGTTPCATTQSVTNCSLWSAGTGTLQVSPGEQQVMDCYIGSPTGLCGLYRVDVESGGYDWYLYANCDGLRTPRFQVFDSCAPACAAYTPRPELTVSNLANTGNCPASTVEFTLTNIGCTAVSNVEYRIASNCPVPDVVTGTWPGVLAANTAVQVSVPFPLSCTPAQVTITVDPANRVSNECSESPTAAKCLDIPGSQSVVQDLCVCGVPLRPDAGPDRTICAGQTLVLDGAASTGGPCQGGGVIQYQWLDDATGLVLCPWSSSPRCTPTPVPGHTTYRLEQRCSNLGTCALGDTVEVIVYGDPAANAGPDVETCLGAAPGVLLGGDATLPTGSGGSGTYSYDWSPATGLSSTGVENPVFAAPAPGDYLFRVTVTDALTGCQATDDVAVRIHPALVADAGTPRTLCLGSPASVTLGGAPAASGGAGGYAYAWTPLGGATASELSSLTDPNPVYTPAAGNDPAGARFELRVADAAGCASTAEVIVVANRNPVLDPGSDRVTCQGQTVQLGGSPTAFCHQSGGPCAYAWTPAAGLSCTDCPNPVASPMVDTTYLVTVTDPVSGCQQTGSITVQLEQGAPGTPADIGNELRAWRSGTRDHVSLTWRASDPATVRFNVRRCDAKRCFADGTDSAVALDLTGPPWADAGAVPAPPPLLFYRVSGVNCSGFEGPY